MADTPQSEKDRLYAEWEAKWKAADFSWEGLKHRRWRAPVDFPGNGEIVDDGKKAYRISNLQEYWRGSLGVPGYEDEQRLLTEEELIAADLLNKINGKLWHVLHLKNKKAANIPALASAMHARLEAATGDIEHGPYVTVQATGARIGGLGLILRQYGIVADGSERPLLNIDLRHAELTDFNGADLRFGNGGFNSATFTGDARFDSATFEKIAYFTRARWGWDVEKNRWSTRHYGRVFFGTRFQDIANFETDHFNAFAAFDGAQFEKTLYLKEEPERDAHKTRFKEACAAVRAKIEADVAGNESEQEAATKRWNELSSGYRTAKTVMERYGAVERAQRYYRYEVQARLNKPSAGKTEKATAFVYELVSDFGGSLKRPLIALSIIYCACALLYFLLALPAGEVRFGPFDRNAKFEPHVLNAFSLSFKNALLNLDTSGARATETAANLYHGHWVSWFARGLGALQTLSSLFLAFLFGLAVRRKFQIR